MKKNKKTIVIFSVLTTVLIIAVIIAAVNIIPKNKNTENVDVTKTSEEVKSIAEKYVMNTKDEEEYSLVYSEQVDDNVFVAAFVDENKNRIYRFIDEKGNDVYDTSFADGYSAKVNEYIKDKLDKKFKEFKLFTNVMVNPLKNTELNSSSGAKEIANSENAVINLYIAFPYEKRNVDFTEKIIQLLNGVNARVSVFYVSDIEFLEDETYLLAYNPSYSFTVGKTVTLTTEITEETIPDNTTVGAK